MVSYKLTTGNIWTPVIRAYLLLSTFNHLPDLEEALYRFPDSNPILLGDLNADIGRLLHHHDRQIADFLATFGLVDILAHFWQRLQYRDGPSLI